MSNTTNNNEDVEVPDDVFGQQQHEKPLLPALVVPEPTGNDVEDDYALARASMRDLVVKANQALDDILKFARDSEHPRVFEVASQLINAVSDASTNLLEMQKKHKNLSGEAASPSGGGGNINVEAVFIGSTADLQEIVKANIKKPKVIDVKAEPAKE